MDWNDCGLQLKTSGARLIQCALFHRLPQRSVNVLALYGRGKAVGRQYPLGAFSGPACAEVYTRVCVPINNTDSFCALASIASSCDGNCRGLFSPGSEAFARQAENGTAI